MVMNYTPPKVGEPEPQAAKTKRIDIPIDPYDEMLMRDIGEAMRACAYKLEMWAKLDREEREKRIMSVAEIDHLNEQIRLFSETRGYYWRAGRPKASRSLVTDQSNPAPRLRLHSAT